MVRHRRKPRPRFSEEWFPRADLQEGKPAYAATNRLSQNADKVSIHARVKSTGRAKFNYLCGPGAARFCGFKVASVVEILLGPVFATEKNQFPLSSFSGFP